MYLLNLAGRLNRNLAYMNIANIYKAKEYSATVPYSYIRDYSL